MPVQSLEELAKIAAPRLQDIPAQREQAEKAAEHPRHEINLVSQKGTTGQRSNEQKDQQGGYQRKNGLSPEYRHRFVLPSEEEIENSEREKRADLHGKKDARRAFKKKEIVKADPFEDIRRLSDNAAADADAAEQFGHERAKAMRDQVDRKLIQIRKALTQIKIGKYAICEKCGQMIDTDRLMVMPEATVCIKCEKKKAR